jgi:hypothetical protein
MVVVLMIMASDWVGCGRRWGENIAAWLRKVMFSVWLERHARSVPALVARWMRDAGLAHAAAAASASRQGISSSVRESCLYMKQSVEMSNYAAGRRRSVLSGGWQDRLKS